MKKEHRTHLIPSYNAEEARKANEIGRLIRTGRKRIGMTQADLAQALSFWGVSVKAAAVAKWETGGNIPSGYQLLALCHALGLQDGIFAFSGHVPPGDITPEGYRILNEFHAFLASSGRYGAGQLPSGQKTVEMRVYDLPVSAGGGSLLESDHFEMLSFDESEIPEGADFGVRVSGNSMEPAFHDGQVVWVRSCDALHEGEIGVFFYDGCSYIKEYHELRRRNPGGSSHGASSPRIVWRSLNPEYTDIPILGENYRLFGKVLG